MKKILSGILMLIAVLTLTSAVPVGEKNKKTILNENLENGISKLNTFSKDGKLSYSEIKDVATTIKGESLTLKEKIALKVFGKKISNKVAKSAAPSDGKSQVIALLLVLLVGVLGIHRFYLGYTWQGIVQLLTAGGCGIWALIDLIRIITGDLKPKDGEYGTKL